MAVKLGLSNIRDFINLTFCCQQATVIADFSDLERVGKDYALTMSGGSMPSEEYDQVDGRMAALDLLQNHSGTITPYGVVYDNGMKLEPLYDGRHFPAYLYKPSLMVLEVEEPRSFREAGAIAMDINDYELVEGSEREYAITALGYAGAGDEILELLDGFTDFDALGRSEMENDGVRETRFGHVRRLSAPWPEPEIEPTMC